MRKKILSIILCGVFATTLGLTGCGNGATSQTEATKGGPTVLKLAFNQDEKHPQYLAMKAFTDTVKEKTNGAYDVEIYPKELLGSQKETLEMVQSGTVAMSIVANSLLEGWNQDFSVFNLPYVFSSVEHQRAIVNDPNLVGDLYNSLKDQQVKVLCAFHGGVRNIYTSYGPVTKPEDLKGKKIRVMQSDTNMQMMKIMGGTGVSMGQGDVYTAIQTKVLDGAENNELIYNNLLQYEVGPYYSYTKHLMQPDMLVINQSVWDSLPDDVKKIFEDNIKIAVNSEYDEFKVAVDASLAAAKEKGAKITTDVDIVPFQEAVKPLTEAKINSDITKKIYKKIQDTAGQYK
ncbi:TRAP transporter substrate-binding protein [Clostridium bowmanii]|uniref:TRAP transporter substrate-binding protein n=1 Tax=Clostridium bowmanii TaxID=132925 RepID=UPI001C0AA258|nr:TRAP transporter substrate-binding protein [Clostridium bowmanii]MBU3191943.1 TRAP transporter substrate-binding protein [Clostridium bowmanii]MCA1074500.1 TRAP transporter substrate-binding protein [Clostridium bowmanii]